MKLYRLSIVNGHWTEFEIAYIQRKTLSSMRELRDFLTIHACREFGVEGKDWRICRGETKDCLVPLTVNQIVPVHDKPGQMEYGDSLIIK